MNPRVEGILLDVLQGGRRRLVVNYAPGAGQGFRPVVVVEGVTLVGTGGGGRGCVLALAAAADEDALPQTLGAVGQMKSTRQSGRGPRL